LHGKAVRYFGVNKLGSIHQEVGTLFGIAMSGCDAQVVHVKASDRPGHSGGQFVHDWLQDSP
jgi:hypothetical protein